MSTSSRKVVLLTGASSGLGAETARLLSRQGATVFGLGRDDARLADVFADVSHGAYASVDLASPRPAGTRLSNACASSADSTS